MTVKQGKQEINTKAQPSSPVAIVSEDNNRIYQTVSAVTEIGRDPTEYCLVAALIQASPNDIQR